MNRRDDPPNRSGEKHGGEKTEQEALVEEVWRSYLTTGTHYKDRRYRQIFRMLPGHPRCNGCYVPFEGLGGTVAKAVFNRRPSNLNPQLCNVCELFAEKYQGGAEIELSLLFVDVRGSTTLAETMSPKEFSKLINRFYEAATEVMVQSDAFIDKIIGDQVAGMYVPGFAGPEHPRRAIEAAQAILRAAGYGGEDEPWIQLGAGVHTGIAFVGSLGSELGPYDITVLGDAPNTAARLSTSARQGEILISEAAFTASGLDLSDLEQRELQLKGKHETVRVWVMRV
jgi:adenylate cyclase